ncbi:ABC transporter ATP-binding protein [Breoghania sp.]|uniref:ABC transporter ATP-binding protein n=1 Tax=Breoghania sp. TaxID=2065378 RepID=UPI002AA71501|nr:ABC transporter ATP-binding protein [Breoghania sp.]
MMLHVTDMGVRLGGRQVLSDISFAIRQGEVVGLLGPNGAGKSTLIKALAGIIEPTEGHLTPPCAQEASTQSGGGIAYLPQDGIGKTGLSVVEAILLGRHDRLGLRITDADLDAAHAALARFSIADLADRRIDTLSGGQRQLVGLAQVLFRQPRIMLLDEPTSALDLYRQLLVLDNVRELAAERNITVICVLHDLSLAARFAERIVFLKDGRLIADDASSRVMTSEMLGRIYNIEAEILTGREGHMHVAAIRALPQILKDAAE